MCVSISISINNNKVEGWAVEGINKILIREEKRDPSVGLVRHDTTPHFPWLFLSATTTRLFLAGKRNDVGERGKGVDNLRQQGQGQGQEETHLSFLSCRSSGQISLSIPLIFHSHLHSLTLTLTLTLYRFHWFLTLCGSYLIEDNVFCNPFGFQL